MTRILGFCAVVTFAIAAFGVASADARVVGHDAAISNAVILSLPGGMPTQVSGTVSVAGVGSLPSTSTGTSDLGSIAGFAAMAAAFAGGAIVLAVRRGR